MDIQSEIQLLQSHAEGYSSWGNLDIQLIGFKENDEIFFLDYQNNNVCNLNDINYQDDLKLLVIKNILTKRKNVHAIIIAKQEYGSKVKTEIPAILDDQAQLLGISIRIAHLKEADANVNKDYILKAISNRYACVDSNGLVYSIGNTLEDAYVAAWLVEKTSKAFLESKYLGGSKSINKIEAWLMHKFYMLKYSKEAHKNK